jgi:hypothetical protein
MQQCANVFLCWAPIFALAISLIIIEHEPMTSLYRLNEGVLHLRWLPICATIVSSLMDVTHTRPDAAVPGRADAHVADIDAFQQT